MTTSSVWIVDDDQDDQFFIKSAFEYNARQTSVVTLNDGVELLAKLMQESTLPCLILLDINMPRKNGFEVLQELRSTPAFAHLPVAMLTTSSDKNDHDRSYALGANQFLTKPSGFDQLKVMAHELSKQWALA